MGGLREFGRQAKAVRIGSVTKRLKKTNMNRNPELAAKVGAALRRAAASARRTARMYGTPIYIWENGRIVAKRP